MELTLLQAISQYKAEGGYTCFNPCFIGTYSITGFIFHRNIKQKCGFNPCFIGTYSITMIEKPIVIEQFMF